MEAATLEIECRFLGDQKLPLDNKIVVKNNNSKLFNGKIHSQIPKFPILPNDYEIRELSEEDFDQGFLELLEQLTTTLPITRQQFIERLHQMRSQQPRCYHIFVIRKISTSRIVATAALVCELKFVHNCGMRGRVEDVVVDSSERGKRFGQILNEYIVQLAHHMGVYKLSLECKDHLIPFYQKFGYRHDGNNFLVQRFI